MTGKPPNPLSGVEPWDLVAGGYAAEATPIMRPFSERALEIAGVSADAVVLDVATGPGTLALLAAARVKRVQAVDFSPSMLDELKRNLTTNGVKNVSARLGDGQALEFPEASFDATFSMFGLMFFPDRLRGFREMLRVLRPGGVAVVSSWAPLDESPLMSLLFGAIRAADPSMPAPQKDMLSLENQELFQDELVRAGFSEVSVAPHEASFEVTDSDDLWTRMAKSSAPLVLMRRRIGEEAWAVRGEVARGYLAEQLGGRSLRLSTKAFLGSGRKPR